MSRDLRRSNSVCGRIIQKEEFSDDDTASQSFYEDQETCNQSFSRFKIDEIAKKDIWIYYQNQ